VMATFTQSYHHTPARTLSLGLDVAGTALKHAEIVELRNTTG